jgi:hypothetical protein
MKKLPITKIFSFIALLLNIFAYFPKKFEMASRVYSGAQGKLIPEKNLK